MIIASADKIRDCNARGVWKNILLGDWLDRNVRMAPDREALVDPPNRPEFTDGEPRRLSWRGLSENVDRFAWALVEAGLRKDDVAVLQVANTWELPALYLACAKVGVIATPVTALYRQHELAHIVRTTNARALICSSRIKKYNHVEMMRGLAGVCPSVKVVLALGASPSAEVVDLSAALAREPDHESLARYIAANAVSPNDVVNILWTSGTEGAPKGVAKSHNDWTLFADVFGEQFGIGNGCRLLAGRQLVTCGSFTAYIVPWLANAGTIVCHHPFQLDLFLKQLEEEKITFTSLAPAILHSIFEQMDRIKKMDLSHLKCVSSGSSPLPSTVVAGLEASLGVRIVNVFGSTEGANLMSFPEDVPDARLRGTHFPRYGQPFAGGRSGSAVWVEARLVDPESESEITEAGHVGEIRFRGPMVFDGYYNAAALDAAAFDREGFYRSGDLFEIAGDRQQYYRYVGRSKDIVVRGGLNVSAAEIEDLLFSHPKVRDCAVVGSPDPRLGETVCVFVVPREGASISLAEITEYLRDQKRLAVFKLPERLELIGELPRTGLGKVHKGVLRKRLAGEPVDIKG